MALLLIVFVQSGCKSTSTTQSAETPAPPEIACDPHVEGEELVFLFSDFPAGRQNIEIATHVTAAGSITLLSNQVFTVIAKTRSQLKQEIHDRYVPQYYESMTVSLLNEPHFLYVGGEVRSPGRLSFTNVATVLSAIEEAGGFTEHANPKRVRVVDSRGGVSIVNCLHARSNPRLDRKLSAGDKITVLRSIWR